MWSLRKKRSGKLTRTFSALVAGKSGVCVCVCVCPSMHENMR